MSRDLKVLVVGSGGREHALVWVLAQSAKVSKIFCSPGSDAIHKIAEPVLLARDKAVDLPSFAQANGIELTVVGPEGPLAEGLSDEFRRRGLAIVGPQKAAAQLESSKIFAKEMMQRHSIPTARFACCDEYQDACDIIERGDLGFPVVVKADGLAAGKGVAVCQDKAEALTFLKKTMKEHWFGAAGNRVVIEEHLAGEEVTYMVLTDGRKHVPLPPVQDHKRLLEDDLGPNTGGMGAYSGDSILTPAETLRIEDTIVKPVLQGMAEEGNPFQGILYFGLMLTSEGPKVLEFNVRLGDPETQALVMRSSGDLATTLYSVAIGELSADAVQWYPGAALCVVLATPGYPDQPIRGASIRGLEMAAEMKNVQVFHAGTRFREGIWETAGGRVLGVTGRGATLAEASMTAYEAVNRIHFEGMHYRRDIGAKGLHKIRKSGLTEE